MKTRPLLVIAVGLMTLFGVAASVIGTVAQLTDFRPIRANGEWQSERGENGTWSAELKLDGRLLSGDIVVVGHETFGTGQIQATLALNGNLEDAELTFAGESLATFSGRLSRDSLRGSFRISANEAGEWSGDWRGVPPPGGGVDTEDPAEQTLQAPAFEAQSTGVREGVDIELPKVTVETNQLASVDMDFGNLQREVEVAVDRSGVSNRVALAAIDEFLYPLPHPEAPDLAYYISPDGGDTWPASLKGVPPGLEQFEFGADPVIDYDRNGNLYYCGVVEDINPAQAGINDQAIFVARMPPQTDFFQSAVLVRLVSSGSSTDPRTVDKPWCATGVTPGGSPQDVIYVTWLEYDVDEDVATIQAAYSLNGGASFVGQTMVSDDGPSDPTDAKWPQVEVNPDTKSVNFVWMANEVGTTDEIRFDRCNFSGAGADLSCGTDVVVKTILKPDDQLPGTNFRMSWFPYLATSEATTGTGLIYVLWTEKNTVNGDTDIRFRRSDGQSINFNTERVIAGASQDEFFPALTVDENFFIRVVYLRRVSDQTDEFNVFSVFSGDAGLTWNGPTQVNDGGDISPVLPPGDDFIGDYIGIDAKFERHPGWMDTRRGNFDAYSAVMFGC